MYVVHVDISKESVHDLQVSPLAAGTEGKHEQRGRARP